MRYALIASDEADVIAQYLPANYKVVETKDVGVGVQTLIAGDDNLGWTLDDYVLPRLGSGLYFGQEIDKLTAEAFQLAIDLSGVKAAG